MMKNVIRSFLLLPLLLSSVRTPPARGQDAPASYSLEQCVRYAKENNYSLHSSKLDEMIAGHYIREVRSNGLPQLGLTGVYEDNISLPVSLIPGEVTGGEAGTFIPVRFGTKYNLRSTFRADQLLYDGVFWTGIKAAKQSLRYYKERTNLQTETIVYNVNRSYYLALTSREQLQLISYNLRNTEELLKLTQLQYENGLSKRADRDRVQVDYNNLLADYQNAGREAAKALNQLKFDMGMPVEATLRLAAIDTTVLGIIRGVDTAATAYYTNRIDFKVLQIGGDLLKLDLQRIRAGYQPSLGAYLSAGLQAQRQNFNFFNENYPWFRNYLFGLQLNVPVFDGLRKHYQAQQGKLNVKKNEVARTQLMQQVSLEVANATTDLSNRMQTLQVQQRNVGLAQAVYEDTKEEYRAGTGSYNNLVDAETALRRSQTSYITALLNAYLSKVDLLKAQGRLL